MSFFTISALQPGQRVTEWAATYKAQTTTLDDAQKRGLLPAYVCRSVAERVLAAEAAGLESLEKALESLVKSIDGEHREVESARCFFTREAPEGGQREKWVSFIVEQHEEAKKAELGSRTVVMRMLSMIKDGQVVYGKLKDKIKDNMTVAELVALLDNDALKGKLVAFKDAQTSPAQHHPEEEAFEYGSGDESQLVYSDAECLMICFGCNRKGHIKRNCKAKCTLCNKTGHVKENCRAKNYTTPKTSRR